jgi:predicted GNAT family acetyltransferase
MRRMALVLHRFPGVDAFLAAAQDFLVGREAQHNLILGLSTQVRLTPDLFSEDPPTFATVVDGSGRIVAASIRTPPNNQVLSEVDDLAAVDLLVEDLAATQLPGVLGPPRAAARFAARWTELTGRPAWIDVRERIHRLDRVVPPARPAPGSWRHAAGSDAGLIADWVVAFADEALPGQPPIGDPHAIAERWTAGIYRRMYLWEDGGRVTSMAGAGGETPNGIRIGPVYTPPADRGRGYATSLTAAASQDQLDRGRPFVFLFTDLANPTSNAIYRAIGYEPVCDVDMYRFGTDA